MKSLLLIIGTLLFCCSCKVTELRSVKPLKDKIYTIIPELEDQEPSLALIEAKFGKGNTQASPLVHSWYIERVPISRTVISDPEKKKGRERITTKFGYQTSKHPGIPAPNYLHDYKNNKIRGPQYELLVRCDEAQQIIEMKVLWLR